MFKEVGDGFGNTFGREMPVHRVVNLDQGREGAASQTGDRLDREFARLVGVDPSGNSQFAADRILDTLRTLDMTGGAMTNPQEMATPPLHAELGVKAGDSHNLRRGDFGQFADPLQRLEGEVVELGLNRLEDRDDAALIASEFRNDLLDSTVYRGSFASAGHSFDPMQNRCSSPRISIRDSTKAGEETTFSPTVPSPIRSKVGANRKMSVRPSVSVR